MTTDKQKFLEDQQQPFISEKEIEELKKIIDVFYNTKEEVIHVKHKTKYDKF